MNNGCGILRWGYAIPRRRLSHAETFAAWKRPPSPGSRAIASHDEDTITLGVQAVLDALEGIDSSSVDGLIFASTTAPFAEKSSAVLIADILDLAPTTHVLDINSSLRAGTIALSTAWDWIASGSCSRVLVIAADTRLPSPGIAEEIFFGHAGIALLVGTAEGCTAELVARSSFNTSILDSWRPANARFPFYSDQRFARERAYIRPMQNVLKIVLEKTGWQNSEIGKVVPYSPDVKSGSTLLKGHGFDLKTQYCDLVSSRLGLTGTAHTLLMLCAALEKSTKDERLLILGYGDGADAFALFMKSQPSIKKYSSAVRQSYDISYNRYLHLHGLHSGVEKVSEAFTSEIMSERNKELWLKLKAHRCSSCGAVTTLPLPSCPKCRDDSHLELFQLQRQGTVYAITHEHYFPTPEPPLGMAAVDLDGGGRLTVQIADENLPLKIGDLVELVFRRMHDAGNFPNYFWKCRSLNTEENPGAG